MEGHLVVAMRVATKKFIRKPLFVEAVQVTDENFDSIAKWCHGDICADGADHVKPPGTKYIRIHVLNPMNPRQTRAYVGDWILYTDKGFKIYTDNAFTSSFDEAPTSEAGSEEKAA